MTTDLERMFFDTFGIKQKEYTQCTLIGCRYVYKICNNCQFHNVYKVDYPQITDTHYLKLICMVLSVLDGMESYVNYDVEKVKEKTLRLLITFQDDVYSQVQELFKEDRK